MRFFAGLGLLVSVVGLLLSLGAIAGLWLIKGPAAERIEAKLGRLQYALDLAARGLQQAKAGLGRATERLEAANAEQRRLAAEPARAAVGRRMLARTIHQQVAPEVTDAQAALHLVAEAAFAVNVVLEDAGEFPLLASSEFDLTGLERLNGRLGELAKSAWDASRLFADGPDAEADGGYPSRVERTLVSMRQLIAEYEPQVVRLREQVELLRRKKENWLTPAAVGLSLVLLWIGLSQLCVAARCWRGLRRDIAPA